MRTGFLLVALFAFVVVALLAAANATWKSRTTELLLRLDAGTLAPVDSVFTPAMLDSLPAPVARYLRASVHPGAPLAWRAVVRQQGQFRADTAQAGWWTFDSEEHFGARPPGFVWDARMSMLPGVRVFVRDALVSSEGSTQARLAGFYPVAGTRSEVDLAAGALHRWLAETAWFPTALLPGQSVTWTAIDDSTARASASAGGTTVSLDFHFGTDSLVSYVRTDARARTVGGMSIATPWRGTWTDWRWYGDVRIPMRAEVEWQLPSGPFP
jgi:hypothetical protein